AGSVVGVACLFSGMLLSTLFLRLMLLISPSVTKKILLKMGEKATMTQNPNFKYEDWGLTFTSLTFVKTACLHMWLSLGQEAFVGSKAPDSPVVTLEGTSSSIFKYLKDNRPLVLSFGSCT
uniref:Iodothyronine deiodinase n=1 Tax=Myripristis murdjan TaxID=586833 RepID=A0A667WJN2_9TELE